ncbi:MAG: methyltransferase domain-containing protein [Chloroflexi bacterium]|nr:methyltransferase domain-containing protein [Chloroflexota bacterium]
MTAERWSGSDDYEWYVGRWSRLVAAPFLEWLAIRPGADWIDVGCGTGNLTARILELAAPRTVLAVDPSADFLSAAAQRTSRDGVRFVIGSAEAVPGQAGSADAVVSGLVLNFVPDAAAALREAVRLTRPRGTVAAYVWDYAEGMELMRRFWDAATVLDAAAAQRDEGRRFSITNPAGLTRLWSDAGLTAVEVRSIDIPTEFRDFDDYWGPFLTGVGAAPAYAAGLDAGRQERLRERLRASVPVAPDGTLRMTARAWAVRGER